MADPDDSETRQDAGLIEFTPDIELEWELGLDLEVVFTPDADE